jgi:hypothetical protein
LSKPLKLVFLLGLWQSVGFACSCSQRSNCWTFANDGLEFLGRATRVRSISGVTSDPAALEVDFSVSETFGNLGSAEVITVRTNAQSTACGYPFKVGTEYLVFANARRSELWTSSCSGTQPAITATAWLHQLRAIKAGGPVPQIFGFVGTEPYPGVSPLSRLSAKPIGSISVTAVGKAGKFVISTEPDGSFEFTDLPASAYRLQLTLPADLFIWFEDTALRREFVVAPGTTCEADFPLFPKDDPFGTKQRH